MPRTTDDLVKEVMLPGKDYDTENAPSLTRFIKIANLVVTQVAACATAKGSSQDSEVLTEMETWLAAHYYVQSDQVYTSKSNVSASGSFQGSTSGEGIKGSKYGQAALDLDFTGCLEAITAKRMGGIMWGGKPASEQIPYYERD